MGVKPLGITPCRKAERPPFAGVWFAGCSLSGEPESGCAGEGSTRSRQELTARQCRLLTSPVSGHTRALSPTLVLSAVVPSRHRCRRPANGHGRMATVVYASPNHYSQLARDVSEHGLHDTRLAISTATGLRSSVAAAFLSGMTP